MDVPIPEVNYDTPEAHPSSTLGKKNKVLNSIDDTGTLDLRVLSLNNISSKLKTPGQYDIGGCSQESMDLWFFFTTSVCPGDNYLLNIFVCNIKPSFVLLNICSSNKIYVTESGCILSAEYENIFMIKNEGNNHLRTYRFTEKDIELMKTNGSHLRIPIRINVCSEFSVQVIHPLIKNKIKLDHNFGSLLTKTNNYDYVLISKENKRIDCHKIVLIAHSTVFKEMINETIGNILTVDLKNLYLSVIVDFMYTGVLRKKQQRRFCFNKLLNIAEKFKILTLAAYAKTLLNPELNCHNSCCFKKPINIK